MADLSFPAFKLPAIAEALGALHDLQPPLGVKAKYVVGRAAPKIAAEAQTYMNQKLDLMRKHAPRDEKNEPILVVTEIAPGKQSFQVTPVDPAAYKAEADALDNEVIPIPGSRMITHAEVGACPIPQGAYNVLLGTVIVDEEPV